MAKPAGGHFGFGDGLLRAVFFGFGFGLGFGFTVALAVAAGVALTVGLVVGGVMDVGEGLEMVEALSTVIGAAVGEGLAMSANTTIGAADIGDKVDVGMHGK